VIERSPKSVAGVAIAVILVMASLSTVWLQWRVRTSAHAPRPDVDRVADTGVTAAAATVLDTATLHELAATLANARIAQDNGDLAGAASDFERVLARDPGNLDARAGLGIVRGRQGRTDEAIALLEPVVRESPSNADALSAFGAALARSGAPGRAIPYLERAVEAGRRTPPVLNDLAFARLEAGDRAGAIAALRTSLSLKADQPAIDRVTRELAAESARLRNAR
jgi:Flp pilus assembly protein TadD